MTYNVSSVKLNFSQLNTDAWSSDDTPVSWVCPKHTSVELAACSEERD